MSYQTPTSAASQTTGGSVGSKIKGAFQTVHGAGERIRGNALDAADSATGHQNSADTGGVGLNPGSGAPKGTLNAGLDKAGRREQAEGVDRLAS